MENPQTTLERIDAAWNHVEQSKLALMIGDKTHVMKALQEASRLLSVAVEDLQTEPVDAALEYAKLLSLYHQLIFSVGNCYPGETRHETALKYILQAEQSSDEAKSASEKE